VLGSAFIAQYAKTGLPAWEGAAIAIARAEGLVPWPWVTLELWSATGDVAQLQVQSDVLAVGTPDDYVRLPLTTRSAQAILNDSTLYQGAVLPTPWLAYQIYRAAAGKLAPTAMVPNIGAQLSQYADHSRLVDQQLSSANLAPGLLVTGHKKDVVVSNIYKPGRVLLFGWYRPPPAPDVLDDGTSMTNPARQPIQPRSNVHAEMYVDYSHGIRAVHGLCSVNGVAMATEDLYRHPRFSALVSDEGPVRTCRYPAPIAPVLPQPLEVPVPVTTALYVPDMPADYYGNLGLLDALGRAT
jgi:hypothetical protein